MGQGGFITLVNATNVDWEKIHQHSYQMNSWDFPETILAKTSQRIYVEWDQGIYTHQWDDAGEAVYRLKDTGRSSFQVQARASGDFHLQIYFDNLETSGNVKGSVLNLGWKHDGIINFILAGNEDNYTGTNLNAASWMKDNLSLIGNKKLIDICITGSHDSGMSVRTSGTPFGIDCNTLTQSYNIQDQLNLGARYFDIRPIISGGMFYTGHYGQIFDTTWQGANGQSMKSIVSDINSFTKNNAELIVLNLSHSLNTDVGNNSYRPFTQEEWNNLFSELDDLKHLFITQNNSYVNLIQKTLNSFISSDPAVLLIIEDNNIDLGSRSGRGFYHFRNFNVYNEYSNTNDVDNMANDQINKMNSHSGQSYFLLSWTLTQDATQAVTCVTGLAPSIKALADQANQNLAYRLNPAISSTHYPNIIYVDNIISSEAAAMAVAVNWKVLT